MPPPDQLKSDRVTLAIAGLLALGYRLAIISLSPEADGDAIGHWVVAQELSRHPGNISANWVWLPGWHYLLVAWRALKMSLFSVRIANAMIQTFGPYVLYEMARRTAPQRTALLAALAWTSAALANRLAASAESETCFTLLMVLAASALATKSSFRNSIGAGVLLAIACLTRYEAWGAVGLLTILVACRTVDSRNTSSSEQEARRFIAWPTALVPLAGIALWVWARSKVDGAWFTFLLETHTFAVAVHDATGTRGVARELAGPIWYAIVVPAKAFGPALLLIAAGLRRWSREATREELAIGAGLFAFVWSSFVFHGSLGIDRHLTSVVPFACRALAHGIGRVEEGLRSPSARRLVFPLTFVALIATTLVHGRWLLTR
jgi:hypothetical protein